MALTILVAHPSRLFTDHLPWGDGLIAHEFVRRLAERGHRLHVACQRVALSRPLPPQVTLHPLGVEEGLRAAGRVRYMRRLRALYERLDAAEGIDVAHQLNPVDVGLSLALPARVPLVLGPYIPDWPLRGRAPEALTPRDRARATLADGARRALRLAQQRRAQALLITTPAARAKVQTRSEPPVVELLPYGIDAAAYAPARPDQGRAPTVLYLGSLHYRKGIFTLLEAHERVVRRMPGARLEIAGSGREEAAVRERVAASPARDSIALLGRVEREAVAATLAGADVFCVPSYGEPFGLSALEAMACALPVVATDAGGLAHVVDAEGGLKVPPRDPEALAGALATLLSDPARRAAMGAANRRRVERDYGWPAIIGRLEAIYARSVARAGAPAAQGSAPRP